MLSILFSIVFASSAANAFLENAKTPVCLDFSDEISVDNVRALKFKAEQKNGALTRAYLQGKVISNPERQGSHDRFSISIGPKATDTVEVIYNKEFGAMPDVKVGEEVIVCGDFINSFAQTGRYPPSPDGAIIHWVHYNPGDRSAIHEHGFVQFGGDLVGFDQAPATAWDGTVGGGNRRGKNNRKNYY